MTQCLLTGNFKWPREEEIDALHLAEMTYDSQRGYI